MLEAWGLCLPKAAQVICQSAPALAHCCWEQADSPLPWALGLCEMVGSCGDHCGWWAETAEGCWVALTWFSRVNKNTQSLQGKGKVLHEPSFLEIFIIFFIIYCIVMGNPLHKSRPGEWGESSIAGAFTNQTSSIVREAHCKDQSFRWSWTQWCLWVLSNSGYSVVLWFCDLQFDGSVLPSTVTALRKFKVCEHIIILPGSTKIGNNLWD